MDGDGRLLGGNSLSPVHRVGGTIRKRATQGTPAVHAFLTHLSAAGVDVPAASGVDEAGRQVLEFIPGTLATERPALAAPELRAVGRLIRRIHDASAGFIPPLDPRWETAIPTPGAELVCHNDLAPWNLIMGDRLVFIDWDATAPSTRLWDLAYAAQAFTLNDPLRDPAAAARDLALVVDGYDADDALRANLAEVIVERVGAMDRLLRESHRTGLEPWSTMHATGHGAHWAAVLGYVRDNEATFEAAVTASVPRD